MKRTKSDMRSSPSLHHHHSCCWRYQRRALQLTLTLLLSSIIPASRATIYVENETIPSLPALFGQHMVAGKTYVARLQFLPENPYLCDYYNGGAYSISSSFVPPGPVSPQVDATEPVALLASRGNCPFSRKAAVAQSIHPTVQFLIIHNYHHSNNNEQQQQQDDDDDDDNTLVPMYSEYGDSRLVLLSITHGDGQVLRRIVQQEPAAVHALGGPTIALDSQPPPGMMTTEDLQQMLMTALGLFFLLVSFSGCVMILVGTYGQLHANGHIVFSLENPAQAFHVIPRTKLTHQQVEQYLPSLPSDGTRNGCAICLDEDDDDDDHNHSSTAWTVLPCNHHFHQDCIVPWLTERQAKCPLCKYDVLKHILENPSLSNSSNNNEVMAAGDEIRMNDNHSSNNGSSDGDNDHDHDRSAVMMLGRGESSTELAQLRSLWTRITRYRWTQVNSHDDEHHPHGVIIAATEMVVREDDDNDDDSNNEASEMENATSMAARHRSNTATTSTTTTRERGSVTVIR